MSDGKQEARPCGHKHPLLNQECPYCRDDYRTTTATRQANQPQEKAQPESRQDVESLSAKFHEIYQAEAKRQGDMRHKDAYDDLPENIKEFDRVLARYVIGLVQRGQQAMAEKAAQAIERSIVTEPSREQLANHIRSLASAEPPQGEAEKEGRRRGMNP